MHSSINLPGSGFSRFRKSLLLENRFGIIPKSVEAKIDEMIPTDPFRDLLHNCYINAEPEMS